MLVNGIEDGKPAGQSPQSDSGQPTQTPDKLIGGKYKTIDEAVLAADQGYHQVNERLSKLTQVLEMALAPQPNYGYSGVPVGEAPSGGGYGGNKGYDAYGRGPQGAELIDPTAFITNPGKFLKERDDRLTNEIINRVSGVVQDVVGNMSVVNDFKSRHQDLLVHEPLVKSFMDRQDQRLPLATRLENAAKETKLYLQKYASGNGNGAPQGNAIVESPTNNYVGGSQQPIGNPNQPTSSESEADLVNYISERNADFAAKFGMTLPK